MSLLSRLTCCARRMVYRKEVDNDLDDEIRSQLDLMTDRKINAGMKPEEARRAAKMELGGIEQLKEQVREVRTGAWFDSLLAWHGPISSGRCARFDDGPSAV